MPETNITKFPPVFNENPQGDTARYVVSLGKFLRPRLFIIGGYEFIFPLGTEGMRLVGNATLAEHKYVGWGFTEVQVVHRDSARIELSGNLPGKTGATNVQALRYLLTAPDPADYKRLELPGIFPQAQKVVMDSYEFQREESDPWGFTYTCTLVRVGLGGVVDLTAASTDPVPGQGKGESGRTFTVSQTYRTLRAISAVVYGDANKWRNLYTLNKYTLEQWLREEHPQWSMQTLPLVVLPLGMVLSF